MARSAPQIRDRIVERLVTSRARAITASRWAMSRDNALACAADNVTTAEAGDGRASAAAPERQLELAQPVDRRSNGTTFDTMASRDPHGATYSSSPCSQTRTSAEIRAAANCLPISLVANVAAS
jgi:hypothetical protein